MRSKGHLFMARSNRSGILPFKMLCRPLLLTVLIAASVLGCKSAPVETVSTSTPVTAGPTLVLPAPSPTTGVVPSQASSTSNLSHYKFLTSIDPEKRYLFYLHGKIIEDQGLPAISPDYGEYQYVAILQTFEGHGFIVISEQRTKNTDATQYAQRVVQQIKHLLEANVPAGYITVVGASKGSYIAIDVSRLLKNEAMNFVLLGSCAPDEVERLKQGRVSPLYGNVLSIYDSVDEYSGTCAELFALSEGKGLARHDEIVLHVGTGHGILYQPLDEWILPTVKWAKNSGSD
jgi:hypothetical protein